jgi:glycosyltransferase involved in cell wall biosynthesis
LPILAARSGAKLLHCTSGSVPLASPLPVVATVHDVAWLRGAQAHAPAYARAYFGAFSAARWKRVQHVMVDSAFTRDELLASADLRADRVSVVYPGVDATFASLERTPSSQALILCVGTVERRKNAAIVIEALASIPDARLICAGPPTPYENECRALAHRLGIAPRVLFAGYVAPAKLLELYATAALAVVPSAYEGFGYAAAQALCAGVPLLAARSSSLVEVVGNESLLLPVDDAASWSRAIAAALAERDAREAAARAGRNAAIARFSWTAAARATAQIYRAAGGG